jgi:DNA repair exonuclease SbcCD ATPase subunit
VIPLRITLRNFLTYSSQPNGAPVDFDFEGARLWSIAGPNGVGKSALFDGITWVLFGEHRGGKSEDHRLVHQGATVGEVRFAFCLAGQTYLVERSVSTKTKNTKRLASVRDPTTGTWQPIVDTDRRNGFDAWVASLGLRYKTFIASTVLLQGMSDRLILAPPKERFEVLSGALDLRAYEALGARAHERAASRASDLRVAEAQLSATPPATAADLEAAEAAVTLANERAVEADARLLEAELALAEAARAERLNADLASAAVREAALDAVLATGEATERDYREWVELSAALPVLRAAVADLARADQSASAAEELESEVRGVDLSALEARAKQSAVAADDAGSAFAQRSAEFARCALDLAAAASAVEEVERCEHLEQLVAAAEADLTAVSAGQGGAEAVYAALAAAELIRDAAPIVAAVVDAEAAHDRRVARCADLGTPAAVAKVRERADAALRSAEEARDRASVARDEAQQLSAAADAKAAHASELLATRVEAAEDGRCSRCGQPIDAAHIKKELTEARAAANATSKAAKGAKAAAVDAGKALTAAQRELKEALTALAECEKRAAAIVTAEDERLSAASALAQARARIDDGTPAAGVARELLALRADERKARLVTLAELPRLGQLATRLRADAAKAIGIRQQIANLDAQLEPMRARFPAAERSARRKTHAQQKDLHEQLAAEVALCDRRARDAMRSRDTDAAAHASAAERCDERTSRARKLHADASAARGRADGALATLPGHIRTDALSDASRTQDACERRGAELEDVESRWRALERARAEKQQVAALRDALARQLDEILPERLVSAATLRELRDDAARAQTVAAEEREAARRATHELRGRIDTFTRLHAAEAAARRAARLASRLDELLGRTRLLARLVRDALRELERLTNETLARTSGGQLEVRLRLHASGGDEVIEIEARDHASADGPMDVAFISGGQKFRVAIALAAAIGQYVGGTGAGRSLVVDEGFGSLDEAGRHAMIAELHVVAPLMDRVIVVSHHEDFTSRELFPSGFLIGKVGKTTTVQRVV